MRSREGGILWHTQGSGKSLIMVWLAKWIREHVKDARVLILTDRTELDEQIEEVFKGVSEDIYRTKSGADLVRVLNGSEEWLVGSLIHKFGASEEGDIDAFLADIQSHLRKGFRAKGEIFVFVDECHRTQSGKLHDAMKALLPGAMLIGFTGTPLLKSDKRRSIETFGTHIHTYKYDEAVRDGVVLDLRYEAREMRVKNLRTIFEAEKKARDTEMMRLKASVEDGTSLGSYRLVERLGTGGMGEVWRGEHLLLSHAAAVKVIRAQDAGRRDQYERLVERFRREAEVTSNLRSPHTVQLFDFGVSTEGTFHYVMELLDGMDTRQMVERFGPLPPGRLVHLLRQACRSLAEAHEHGLVHRDIKPANLFVAVLGGEYDFLKVLDFGMVKKGPSDADVQLTAAGTTLGTPAFMAPELVSGDGPVDGRADLYALGCTAFWILTGMPMFQAKTEAAMLVAHVNTPPPLVSQYSEVPIPRDLEALILQCLEKRPEARPASAVELGDRLGAIRCDAVWSAHDAREWWFAHAPQTGSRSQSRGAGAGS